MSTQNICNICGANYVYRNSRWTCPACGAFKAEEFACVEIAENVTVKTIISIMKKNKRKKRYGR